MRYLAVACDYDGTFAQSGSVPEHAKAALRKLRESGRRSVLVTGRTLAELSESFREPQLFDAIVLENGAVLHSPGTRESTVLSRGIAPEFAEDLRRRGVRPLVSGHVILGTRSPNEAAVLSAIRASCLELHIVFNGDAVLVVPPGVDKASGLKAALRRMGLSPHEVVGVGSGQNDYSFLEACECSAAVADAVSALKASVDFVTGAPGPSGLVELIEELVSSDLAVRVTAGFGDDVVLAERDDGPLTFRPYGQNILVSGPSGAGKSTFASGLIERLTDRNYQLCIIDPEGDYGTLDDIVTLGTRHRAPHIDEILEVLLDPSVNVVVNLLGIPLVDRPDFLSQLLPRLQARRARTGRPHWILIDEVHHLMHPHSGLVSLMLPQRLREVIFITHRPREVAPAVLELVDTVVVVGPNPRTTLEEFSRALKLEPPAVPSPAALTRDEVVVWERSRARPPVRAKVLRARAQRLRHLRKYAEGDLGSKSFIFRGEHEWLQLRARNLASFCELATGVDAGTWLYHLRGGDYSRWVREVIKDDDLAREIASIERLDDLPASESIRLVRDAIDRRYMLPS